MRVHRLSHLSFRSRVTMPNYFLRFADNGRTWALYAISLCLLTGLCFGNLRHHMLDTHDLETFIDHQQIDEDWTFFFSPHKGQDTGRPLAEIVKYGAHLVWGTNPAAFHLLVVVFHLLASLLLAAVCRRMGCDLELAFLGGGLFLLNVAHFQAVHWISALDYPLALVCGLLGFYAYLEFLDTGKRSAWSAFAFYLLLGMMAHLSAAALAPFVFYYVWLRGTRLRALVPQAMLLAGFMFVFFLGLQFFAARDMNTLHSIGEYGAREVWALVAGMGRVVLWLTSRLFTTAHWVPLPVYELQRWELYLGAVLLAGLLALIWKRVETGWVWSGWLLLWLVPFLLLTEKTVFELPAGSSRYLYPASVGSSMLLAWGLRDGALRLGRAGRYAFPALLLSLLFSSYYSLARVEATSLYTSGRCYISMGFASTGVERLRLAIEQGPGAIPLEETYFRIACVLPLAGEDPEPELRKGMSRFPNSFWLQSLQAAVEIGKSDSGAQSTGRERLQKAREAAREEDRERDVLANLAGFSFNLGRYYVGQDELRRGIRVFGLAQEAFPEREKYGKALSQALTKQGNRLQERGEIAAAETALRQALEADPDNGAAQDELERLLSEMSR